jgi:hypothetical protein
VARKGRGGSTPLSRIYVGVQFSDLRAQAGPETLKNQRLKSRSVETAPPAVQACRGARARDRCLVRAKAPELLAVRAAERSLPPGSWPRRPASSASPPTQSSRALRGSRRSPPSSRTRNRYRLDRGGNRRLNCALHRIAVTRGASTSPRASSSPESRPRASPGSRPYAASSATSPERSGRPSEPRSTESL